MNLRVDPVLFRRAVAFGVKAYVAQVFLYLVLRVDQVLVAHYAGYRQLGLYSLATTVAELLWLLTDPLAGAMIPHVVRARTGEDRRLSFSMARLSLCIRDRGHMRMVPGAIRGPGRLRGRVRRRHASVAPVAARRGGPGLPQDRWARYLSRRDEC